MGSIRSEPAYSLEEEKEKELTPLNEKFGDSGVTGGDVVVPLDCVDGEDCGEDGMDRCSLERECDLDLDKKESEIGTEKALETRSEKVEDVLVLDW